MNHSLELDRKLSRITWVTVLLTVTVFLIAFWFLLFDERKKDVIAEDAFLSQVIDAQEKALQNEMFLNLQDAIQIRLDSIVGNERLKTAHMRACIQVIPLKNAGANYISSCTDPADAELFENGSLSWRERTLTMGIEPVANVRYFLVRDASLDDFLPPKVLFAILFAAIGAFFLHRHAVKNLQRKVVAPLLKKIAQDERNAAIAKTMQMVTHDVRKPFLTLRTIIESLLSGKKEVAEQDLRTKVLPALDQSISTVDSMLSDMLEIGSARDLRPDESSVTTVIGNALDTLLPLFPDLKVRFTYDLRHRNTVRASSKHLLRIVSNLIENGLQAVEGEGVVWFSTKPVTRSGERFIEVTVGNSGSYIDPGNQERIFDPFVTTKQTGYGLGLAIASKFVEDYGGKIWVRSSPLDGTEFKFTLPIGLRQDTSSDATLPKIANARPAKASDGQSKGNKRQISSDGKILVFDDEKVVLDSWKFFAEQRPDLNIEFFESWEDFVAREAFDRAAGATAFVDINFKNSRFNGIDIAGHLRKLGIQKLYAITADPQVAVEAGLFDDVLGKEFPEQLRRGGNK